MRLAFLIAEPAAHPRKIEIGLPDERQLTDDRALRRSGSIRELLVVAKDEIAERIRGFL